jgi:4-carboxymuconolactone decarboxylase
VTEPRIPPLSREDQTEEQRRLLDERGLQHLNVMKAFVHHPELLARYEEFGTHLLRNGTLPDRDRELVTLRVATLLGSEYEWDHHRAGFSEDELAAIRAGSPQGWDGTIVRTVDELRDDGRIADDTWAALAARYHERQLIELCVLVGVYTLLGYVLNSLGVPPD